MLNLSLLIKKDVIENDIDAILNESKYFESFNIVKKDLGDEELQKIIVEWNLSIEKKFQNNFKKYEERALEEKMPLSDFLLKKSQNGSLYELKSSLSEISGEFDYGERLVYDEHNGFTTLIEDTDYVLNHLSEYSLMDVFYN